MKGLRATLQTRTWRYWWMKSCMWTNNVLSQLRNPTISWAVSKEAWPAGQGRWFWPFTPLWRDPTWSPAFISGAPSTGKTWTCWSRSRGGHKNDPRDGKPSLGGKAETVGAVQPGPEKASGRPCCSLPVPERGLQESWRGTIYKGM